MNRFAQKRTTLHESFSLLNPLINILCNKTSITSIVNSNHTLQRVYSYYPNDRKGVSHVLNAVLQMNENTKVEIVRQKIIQYHFMDGKGNIETLVGMELEMMPSAIAGLVEIIWFLSSL